TLSHRCIPSFPTRRSSDLTRANVKAHYYDFVHLIEGDITATKWMLGNPGQAAQIATVTGDSVDVSKAALQHYLSINWWPYKTSRSEEHTSELQSRSDLVCR